VSLPRFLRNLTSPVEFTWNYLLARGTTGGVLVGVRDKSLLVSNVSTLKSSVSCMLLDKRNNFSWKPVVVYVSPYEEARMEFIDELHLVLSSWQGPIVIRGDFNLSRFVYEKSNGRINQKWADCFNDWVNKWGMIELSPTNRKFTWSNNQKNMVLAKLDRVFVSTEWEAVFPLARVVGLEKKVSDHVPLLLDSGENCERAKKKIRFEK
jgi:hypothetical protein